MAKRRQQVISPLFGRPKSKCGLSVLPGHGLYRTDVLRGAQTMVKRLDLETLVKGQELTPILKRVTQEKINLYVSSAEDYNPIHVDPEFGKRSPYGSTIAPGYQVIAYISEVMTRDFGERWILSGKMDVRLARAVLPEDTLTIGGKVTEVGRQRADRIKCEVWVSNQRGEKVISGYTEITI